MPTISWFYGIAIRMFFNDHAPPHFHAYYGDHEAKFAIDTGDMIGGEFPRAQRRLVQRWVSRYDRELNLAWKAVRADMSPERIPGLDADNDN